MRTGEENSRVSVGALIKEHPIPSAATGLGVLVVALFAAFDQTERAADALGLPSGAPLAKGIVLTAVLSLAFVIAWCICAFVFREGKLAGIRESTADRESDARAAAEAARAASESAKQQQDSALARQKAHMDKDVEAKADSQRAAIAKFYNDHPEACVRFVALGGMVYVDWTSPSEASLSCDLILRSSCFWPLVVDLHSVAVTMISNPATGYVFSDKPAGSPFSLEPGARWNQSTPMSANAQTFAALAANERTAPLAPGSEVCVPARLVIGLRIGVAGEKLSQPRSIIQEVCLVVRRK